MTYTVILDANRQQGIAAVHKQGCRDIQRDLNPAAVALDVTGTLRDALDVAVDAGDRELGYTDDDAQVYPCAE